MQIESFFLSNNSSYYSSGESLEFTLGFTPYLTLNEELSEMLIT